MNQMLMIAIFIIGVPIASFILYNIYRDLHQVYKNGTNMFETFVSEKPREWKDNKYEQITLPNLPDYDIEIGIPPGQQLYTTVQGNWGLSTDEHGNGVSMGVYRDGSAADGSIFKGKTGKKFKYVLERGPYVIRYENRKNNNGKFDVNIFVDDQKVIEAPGQGVSSGQLKHKGTNYGDYNMQTTDTNRGRRKVNYIKFIPKSEAIKEKAGFTNKHSIKFNLETALEDLKNVFSKREGYEPGSGVIVSSQDRPPTPPPRPPTPPPTSQPTSPSELTTEPSNSNPVIPVEKTSPPPLEPPKPSVELQNDMVNESNDISNKQLESSSNTNDEVAYHDLNSDENKYGGFNLNIKMGNQDTQEERFMNSLLGMGVGVGLGVGFGSAVAKKINSENENQYTDENGDAWIRNRQGDGWDKVENKTSRSGENSDRSKFHDMSNTEDKGDFEIYDYTKVNQSENRLGGSNTAYSSNYKPEDPTKSKIKSFDSIWKM